MSKLHDYAVKNWGLSPNATAEEFLELAQKQIRRGAMNREKLLELHAEGKQDREENSAALRKMLVDAGIPTDKADAIVNGDTPAAPAATKTSDTNHDQPNPLSKEQSVMDKSAIAAAAFGGGGQVNVRKASERYSTKRYEAKNKHGQPVLKNGAPIESPSDREYALMGAYFKGLMVRGCPGIGTLTEHEQDLLAELANDHEWVGDSRGVYHTSGVKLANALETKGTDYIADSTSGGSSLVPYFYDQEVVNYPLLFGELAPMVDMRDMPTSNQALVPTMQNVSASWQGNPSEGSGAAVSLQTTDALSSTLTNNVYDLVMAITVGRNLMADSPIDVGKEITQRMGMKHMEQVDYVIAIGNGTSQPKGLINSSGMNTVNSVSGSAGPFVVKDVENMISGVPKQYRQKSDPKVGWVFNDSTWFRLRGLSVSGTDQRRIFGYDYEGYMLANRPVKINNFMSQTNILFGKLDLYRLWRRQGLQIESSWQGKTLMLNHEVLFTARARYAGVLTNGAGISYMANASVHS